MLLGSNRVLALPVALLVLSLAVPGAPLRPTPAQAQEEEDEEAKELARKLLAAGDQLMKQGDKLAKRNKQEKASAKYAKALRAYEEAYDRFPAAKIFYAIGTAELKLGRYLDAIRHFRQLLQEADNVSDALRTQVEINVDEAKQYVAVFRFSVVPDGAVISVDDEDIGLAPFEEPLYVEPGEHTIAVTAEGYAPFETSVTMEAGSESDRSVELEKITVVVKQRKPKPKKKKAKKKKTPSVPGRGVLLTGISLTGGLAALATVTGIMAMGKHGDFTDDSLPAEDRDTARDSGKKLALVTDLLWVGTVVVGAYTAYYYYGTYQPNRRSHERRMQLESRRAARRVWVAPYAKANGGGVAVGGTF